MAGRERFLLVDCKGRWCRDGDPGITTTESGYVYARSSRSVSFPCMEAVEGSDKWEWGSKTDRERSEFKEACKRAFVRELVSGNEQALRHLHGFHEFNTNTPLGILVVLLRHSGDGELADALETCLLKGEE